MTPGGHEVSLSQFRGKVVVLDFWATWCPPCREALPHLQQLSVDPATARRGLVVLAIDEQENPPTIRQFLQDHHYTFTALADVSGSAGRDYSASALPRTVVIGRDGNVRAVIRGWTTSSAARIDQAVAAALDATTP